MSKELMKKILEQFEDCLNEEKEESSKKFEAYKKVEVLAGYLEEVTPKENADAFRKCMTNKEAFLRGKQNSKWAITTAMELCDWIDNDLQAYLITLSYGFDVFEDEWLEHKYDETNKEEFKDKRSFIHWVLNELSFIAKVLLEEGDII